MNPLLFQSHPADEVGWTYVPPIRLRWFALLFGLILAVAFVASWHLKSLAYERKADASRLAAASEHEVWAITWQIAKQRTADRLRYEARFSRERRDWFTMARVMITARKDERAAIIDAMQLELDRQERSLGASHAAELVALRDAHGAEREALVAQLRTQEVRTRNAFGLYLDLHQALTQREREYAILLDPKFQAEVAIVSQLIVGEIGSLEHKDEWPWVLAALTNRVASPRWPNTIEKVALQGCQFNYSCDTADDAITDERGQQVFGFVRDQLLAYHMGTYEPPSYTVHSFCTPAACVKPGKIGRYFSGLTREHHASGHIYFGDDKDLPPVAENRLLTATYVPAPLPRPVRTETVLVAVAD